MNYRLQRLVAVFVVSLCLLVAITFVYCFTDHRPMGLVGVLGLCIGYIIRDWDDGAKKPSPSGQETKP